MINDMKIQYFPCSQKIGFEFNRVINTKVKTIFVLIELLDTQYE